MLIRTLVSPALMLAWLALAVPAIADCERPGPLDVMLPDAQVAFVGTVVEVDGPAAIFAVREVWAGAVADTIEVRGLSDQVGGPDAGFGAGFSEDDRHWTEGMTYLVIPWVDGGVLRDSICTATTEWQAEFEDLRPANARIVAASEEPPATVPAPILIVGAGVLILTLASVLAFRRR